MQPTPGYAGRNAVLATMHGKERAVAPVFQQSVGLSVTAASGLDTDQLGTFTGEIPRDGTMLEVAVRKARLGMRATGLPLGLASEGTFGPHPQVPFVAAAIELMVLVDDERGLVVHEGLIAEATNFAQRVAAPGIDLGGFLARIGFPEHALIVRPNSGDASGALAKGIADRSRLDQAVAAAATVSDDGQARLETDMRAHLNPTRMRSLGALAERLARRVATPCPGCGTPGYGRTGARAGLPCEECGAPTEMIAAELYSCALCTHCEARPRPDGLRAAGAGHCPMCNP